MINHSTTELLKLICVQAVVINPALHHLPFNNSTQGSHQVEFQNHYLSIIILIGNHCYLKQYNFINHLIHQLRCWHSIASKPQSSILVVSIT